MTGLIVSVLSETRLIDAVIEELGHDCRDQLDKIVNAGANGVELTALTEASECLSDPWFVAEGGHGDNPATRREDLQHLNHVDHMDRLVRLFLLLRLLHLLHLRVRTSLPQEISRAQLPSSAPAAGCRPTGSQREEGVPPIGGIA